MSAADTVDVFAKNTSRAAGYSVKGDMLFSRLALLLVFIQYASIAYGYIAQSSKLLYHIFIYGSPAYLVQNLLGADSVALETNQFIVGVFVFHIVKYACIFKAQFFEDVNWSKFAAIGLEILYIAYSGYLLYW